MDTLIVDFAKYGIAIPVLIWAFMVWRLPKKDRLTFVILTAVAGIITLVIMKIGSSLHQDPRPFVRDGVKPLFPHGADNGFPSDHTAFGTMLALVVFYYRRWLGVVALVGALLVGTARVASNVHHGQDIVGGAVFALLGVAVALVLKRAFSMWQTRQQKS